MKKEYLPGKCKSASLWLESIPFLSWLWWNIGRSAEGRKYGGREGNGKGKVGKDGSEGGEEEISLSKNNFAYLVTNKYQS